ncbi:GyrI-like domain-containing protein [Vibrio sp. HN007]|uniref:AraC family transcriptional regulator n=1 Tax=Vibrio iocasae TaxID=3098914 RepID=UPI0035D46027
MHAQQVSRINDVLFYIHQDISRDLPAIELANIAAYSEQHFHRTFKAIVGESVHQYIRSTRMEYAANQLTFDTRATVLEVANKSGFSSVSSFSRAFKSVFDVSPGEWRNTESQNENKPYLADTEIAASYERLSEWNVPEPQIVEVSGRHVAYVRHLGYNRSIRNAWLLLKAWAGSEGREFKTQYGLHHSNPAWVELDKCRYVACIEIDTPLKQRGIVNQLTIPGGLYACFRLRGKYGELLPQISRIQEQWLPASGFKMGSTPAYVKYIKNHFIADDERFELVFHLPVSFY